MTERVCRGNQGEVISCLVLVVREQLAVSLWRRDVYRPVSFIHLLSSENAFSSYVDNFIESGFRLGKSGIGLKHLSDCCAWRERLPHEVCGKSQKPRQILGRKTTVNRWAVTSEDFPSGERQQPVH